MMIKKVIGAIILAVVLLVLIAMMAVAYGIKEALLTFGVSFVLIALVFMGCYLILE